jgi:hypothetical protein
MRHQHDPFRRPPGNRNDEVSIRRADEMLGYRLYLGSEAFAREAFLQKTKELLHVTDIRLVHVLAGTAFDGFQDGPADELDSSVYVR